MKIACSNAELSKIVNIVQKAIASKSPNSIIECIKISAYEDGNVTFTANSIEICIEYNTQLTVSDSGDIALPAKIFAEIVRKLPTGMIQIESNDTNYLTDIKCGSSLFNIQGHSVDEFPDAPIVDEQYGIDITQQELKQIIRKVCPFISTNEVRRHALTGALFDIKNDRLNVVGTDSHRLAVIRTSLEGDMGINSFIIPGMTLSKIGQITDDSEDKVRIIISDKNVMFDFGKFQVYSRLLSGEFLKYESILAARNTIKLKVNKENILDCFERANLIINDEMASKTENKLPVKLNIAYSRINISCKTSKSYVDDSVEVEHEGGELLIGLNCRFMLEALNACDDETVIMEFSAPNSGCFIKPDDNSDKYTYMILPVRLYN